MPNKKILWGAIVVFIIAVIITILYIKGAKDATAAGQMGDSFNGLLAPFISFAAALLVYFSFTEQIKANKLITAQWQFDTYLRLFNDLSDRFNKIEVNLVVPQFNSFTHKPHYGRAAFDLIISHRNADVEYSHNIYIELIFVIEEFIFLSELIRKTDFSQKTVLGYKMLRFHHLNFHGLNTNLKNKFAGGIAPMLSEKVHIYYESLDKEMEELKAAVEL